MKNDSSVQSRLLSLDFFRGFTMFLLIAEYTRLFGYMIVPEFSGTIIGKIGAQLHHHPWNGLRFWDLIQPFFMFIVGVAMPLSYAKRIKKGESHSAILKHILLRCLLLLLLGWWIYCVPAGKIVFRFQNVLAQLSVTILIAFLIIRKPAITQLLISLGLIGLMEFIYRIFWIDGFNQPFTPDQNFGAWFDMLIAGELSGGHWVSINAISTAAHTIWGVLAGKLLMSNRTHRNKLFVLVATGVAGLVIGYALNPVTPIIKRISTSSFVFASGGWTILALALSFWLIDMLKFRKGILFFAIVGMNPLFIYLFSHVGGANLVSKIIRPFTFTVFSQTGEAGVNILTSLLATLGLWYICFWMYKRKIFIKI
jgi:predicted acyltransferase